jgi:polysaccharide biosynthesis transport protein
VELRQYFDILRRRWLSIVVTALLILALASLTTLAMPKMYTATTRIFFAVAGESVSDLAQGSTFAERQMSSYAQVATSPMVLEPVIQRLGLGQTAIELADSVKATVPVDTVILEIAATDRDPYKAAEIANAVGAELSAVAGRLSPERQDGAKAVQATTVTAAQAPSEPSSPRKLINLGVGLMLGLFCGIGVAVLRNVLDTKIRDEADVRELTDCPILGAVAYDAGVPRHPVILRDEPLAPPSEAVRRLRTNLQFIDVANRPKSIVISSSVPGEGKSTIALNLAVSLADTGARVILIDADLRRPSIANYIGIEGGVGLTTVLIGRADIEDVIQPFGNSTLDLLPAGQIPPNPSELLGSPAMATVLARLEATYDMVLLDSAPLLPVTDAAVLSNLASGTLLIVGADRIHRSQLQQSLQSLETAGAHIYGIVMNKVDRVKAGAYSYQDHYAPVKERQDRSAVQTEQNWHLPDRVNRDRTTQRRPKPRAVKPRKMSVS